MSRLGVTASLGWVSADARIVILARALRTFAMGFLAVILAVYLARAGFSLTQIGAFFSVGVAGSGIFAFLVTLGAERIGRRRLLVGFSLLSAAAGLALMVTDLAAVLMLFAFMGTLSGGGGGAAGPAQPLEQAALADAVTPDRRTDLFATYRIVTTAAGALGALAAGLPAVLGGRFGLDENGAYQVMFAVFATSMVLVALLYTRLSSSVEATGEEATAERRAWTNPLSLPSRRSIFTLTGLFSVDHFAGQLVIQSLVAYWFTTRFDLEIGSLAFVFFFSQLLAAISLWLAAKIANRIGLINTMVFTHIPSSIFLIAAAFAPTAWAAIMFWQLRAFLGQMDVPTRDSYTMAIVGPQERVAMAGINMTGRSLAGTAGPWVATTLWTTISAAAPFVAAGGLKIVYDVSLYFMFRNVKPPEEQ
ncbi:MAG TPA: MFS transporter [Dehalococcoidia bacterium]|nr:MFS transporter [Dehalococcoidia bacterium]MDP7161234.1 MFS transporter [Dehalococcoidia bacterium]MDP7213607.1 MFS transporter [Dehalococcoidia bacterium]MDP7515061.1 MFS transporter [Dehalococcoidia bacterium]HJM52789.1 MFS transporter [Dehalococcoidia bacterium]